MLFNSEVCEPLHNRNISVSTYAYDTQSIALEGRLTDNRFVATYNAFDAHKPAGIVHDMVIRMIVSGTELIIEAVEVDMQQTPYGDCSQAEDALHPLVGEPITAGFTSKVHQLTGGHRGCAHLVALCRAMASAAVQGAYSLTARKPVRERRFATQGLKHVIDTCHLWKSDGPLVNKLKRQLGNG